jgi:hypothetical protein
MGRQKHLAYAVFTGSRQTHAGITRRTPQELMRDLQKYSRAVTSTRITSLCATVGEIFEHLQALADDVVRFVTFDVDDKSNPARIFFVSRVVEPLLRWKPWKFHSYLSSEKGRSFSC